MRKLRWVWVLVAIVLVVVGLVRGRVEAAGPARRGLLVRIPYTANAPGRGTLVLEILDPEDHVLARAAQEVAAQRGGSLWEQRIVPGTPIALDEVVWDRVRYRFAYADGGAPIEGIVPVSAVLRRPVLRILGDRKYLAGSMAAVRVIVADAGGDSAPEAGTLKIALLQNGDRRELFGGKLNAHGSVEAGFQLPTGVTGTAELQYVADTPDGAAEYTQPIELEQKAGILLTTEKPIYQPGQTIHVRALALDRADHRAVAGRPITFEVEDAKGNKVFRRSTATDNFGVASAEFGLADEVNLGTYHLRAAMGNENTAELALNVQRYVLPKFKVAVEFAGAKKGYRPGDHVTGTVRANYFFGKPVDHADVALKLSGMDVAVFEAASASGRTDGEGAYHFDLVLPAFFAGGRNQGAVRALLEATVKDGAAHSETRGEPVTVSADALLLTAVPEGGTLARGLDNQVFVLASYPDGTPAAGANLVVSGTGAATQRVQADAGGVALVTVRDASTLRVEADDHRGSRAVANVALQTRTGEDQVLLRTAQAVVKAGDRIALEVISTRDHGAAYVDVVKNGQTMLTRDAELHNGHAEVSLVATPEMAGALDLDAYVFGRDAVPVADHRLLFVQPADELRITAASDQPVYKPGAEARIRFHVTNSRGEGVSAALGVQIVDEAVFALAEKQPGFAKVFFYLEQEVMKPRYEIHSLSLGDAVTGEDHTLESRALFAATEMAAPVKVDLEFGRTLPEAHREAYAERYQEALKAQVRRVVEGLQLPARASNEDVSRAFQAEAARRGVLGSWGFPLRMEPSSWRTAGERFYRVVSAGPDHVFADGDDLAVYVATRPGATHNHVDGGFEAEVEHERGAMTANAEVSGMVTDASGAAVADCTVLLRDMLKGVERRTHSNGAGEFRMAGVPAGRYRVEIAASGLTSATGSVVVVERDLATLRVLLNPGNVAQTVEVLSDAAVLLAMPPPVPQPMRIMAAAAGIIAGNEALPVKALSFAMRAKAAPQGMAGPVPAPAEEAHVRSYFPEALYINPEIVTDGHGDATIEVPVADSITTWRMAMVASTARGALGSGTGALKVFQDFFADINLPVTLTEGDRVTLPVALYNYTSMTNEVSATLEPGDWYQLENDGMEKHVKVDSGRVGGASYTIEANKIGKFKLTLRAQMGERRDVVVREIEVVPNGREGTVVANGRLSNGAAREPLRFPSDALPDATTIFVRLYPGPLSQVIEGMDGILRMPGGCFEQTSSSTYPNVLALDYMKRIKKLTPEIHAKAEGYIANGYQRLLTFEVPGGGFSWFGEAPANKILTAYGLMEFNDMSKVSDVDPKVIARTREWLVSQQQPDGSWRPDSNFINEGATDRFNTDVLRITAYVAWSLVSTGSHGEAVERAKHYIDAHRSVGTDAYTLAVIASFAADYGEDDGFTNDTMRALLRARTERGEDILWSSAETGMYGSGDSAAVETTGLAVQALLKWGQANDAVRKALHYITSKKGARGNWGTTQATIMALKALLAASERGSADVHGAVEVLLNGRTMDTLQLNADNNDLLHQFVFRGIDAQQQNEVEVKFSGSGSLAYQVAGRYFVPWQARAEAEALSIEVAYDRTTLARNDIATATATVRNNLTKTANMVMVDLGIPPGFELLTEDLQGYQDRTAGARAGRLEKFSLTATQAILYFNALSPREAVSLKFRLRAKYPIRAKTFASRVYEYYDPQVQAVARPVQMVVREQNAERRK